MRAFLDARAVPTGTVIETDLAIIGGGPAGISLALALAGSGIRVLLLESGGIAFEGATQALYTGTEAGVRYIPLEASRLRFLGGSSNHWGGWCRPLDAIDFEPRPWLAHSGWPIKKSALAPYYERAQSLVEAGPFIYDDPTKWTSVLGAPIALGEGGVRTTYFQFSKQRDNVLPTHFGERYADDLKKITNLSVMLHANVTRLRLSPDARSINRLDVATLSGKRFVVKSKGTVLAAGGVETPRLLLASNDVMPNGVGNGHDLVGRFFADHPIPGNTAIIVLLSGNISSYYQQPQPAYGAIFRAAFTPRENYQRQTGVLCSLATIEGEVQLDSIGRAAVAETAAAFGIDASNMRAFTLGCGMELAPDPDRRLTLTREKDALGMPRLNLDMRIADSDFAHYRATLTELGRQLLAAHTGMVRILHKTREEWMSVMDWGNHHLGTTRMSFDPKSGVVNADCQVHDVHNLFVAGSSVFPTYGASNPTLNLVALTLRLADHLKSWFRS